MMKTQKLTNFEAFKTLVVANQVKSVPVAVKSTIQTDKTRQKLFMGL